MTTPFTYITLEVAEALAIVTVNRPDKLNALNSAVIAELDTAFTELAQRDQVRAIILTGAGRAFVAGADIAEVAKGAESPAGLEAVSALGSRVFTKIERLNKPVIAAINGFALGGGLELALACHIRVASEGAKFGLPEAKLGLIPGYGGTQRLPRLIGTGRAMQMILTGGMIDANTALGYGLVNAVYPVEALMDVARSIAKEISANGPLALAHAIHVVAQGAGMPLDHALALESKHFGELGRSADMREGSRAFLEKRAPSFQGN
jgi:enoyl-CoA hydratase